jgi:hypothetical protein
MTCTNNFEVIHINLCHYEAIVIKNEKGGLNEHKGRETIPDQFMHLQGDHFN